MNKRIIATALTFCLIAGLWNITAYAQELPAEEESALGENIDPESGQGEGRGSEIADPADLAREAGESAAQGAYYAEFDESEMWVIANYGVKRKKGSYLLLKVPGNKNARVTPMTLAVADHSTGELYTLEKTGDWYTVAPLCAASWFLNVEADKADTNIDVGLDESKETATQGWYFEPVGGVTNGYIIRSADNPEQVLDIRGTTAGKGVKIKKYEPDNECQIWIVQTYTPSISLNKKSVTMDVGNTVTLTANKKPVDAEVKYSTNAAQIADVSSTGVVSAKKAGTAVITASCCGKTASCTITVRKSTLAVNPKLENTTITKGSTNGVSGSVTSNKKITKVAAQIIGKDNKVYYSKSVEPNKTSCALTGQIDKAMLFNKLGAGTYVFRVTAQDASGNKVSKDIGCTVKEKAAPTGDAQNKTLTYDKSKIVSKIKNQYTVEVKGMHKKVGEWCGAFAKAYCFAIEKGSYKSYKDVSHGTGLLYTDGGLTSKTYKNDQEVRNRAYQLVKSGKPCIIRVNYKKGGGHFVVVVGYKNVKDPNKVTMDQLRILDPYDTKEKSAGTFAASKSNYRVYWLK